MFKDLNINLTGPICQCKEQDLYWNIEMNNGSPRIVIYCKTCSGMLVVSNQQLKAHFVLDKPYPGKAVEPKSAELKN